MTNAPYKYLTGVNSPDDLKKIPVDELPAFCDELRRFIIGELASNPGHLGSSLGTVELTAALHYVYNTPDDKLIWDVGHQAYAHKIITGRRELFATNRRLGGISGFPRMSESPYDAFGGGHSSVSISAALGIATASELRGEKRDVVAIIGDGALTGGLAFEGLNNAGTANTNLLVILNDNNMSIDQNVGAMKESLLNLSTSRRYNKFKQQVWSALSPVPGLRRFVQNSMNALKQGFLRQSNLFESLNFRYFGPVDGHDVKMLTKVLRDLKNISGPKVLHVLTTKGKGYKPAEHDQSLWHAPGRFDPDTGMRMAAGGPDLPPLYQEVFGRTLLDLARKNPAIVGITPAMPTGCSLNIMMTEMPERCFDVGIAEGHAVTFSAGLATAGLVPFCNIYSSFMQRAYDNVIHDVALQNLGVVFCLDRAGIVGEDGATHHGAFDIAFFRPIPGMVVSSPMNEAEMRNLMYTASRVGLPFVIRYPRGRAEGVEIAEEYEEIAVGRGRVLREGSDVAVLTFGPVGNSAARAAEQAARDGVSVFHADMRFAKPLDFDILHDVGRRFRRVITVEDGVTKGGFGSGVVEFFAEHGYTPTVKMLGIGDRFVEHGTTAELQQECGYTEADIYAAMMDSE
ncbi:1-deoxy-D-xylulose-5-phosphate synthase [Alistipes sp. OttesenSCG-928-B03]|nr:1-deoxy-D-xylulose-5-phosphate synthase [Alistipes sp. OttesenSCG-928-B03]